MEGTHIFAEDDPTPVPRLSFDTQSFSANDRLDAWRQNMGVFFDLSSPDGSQLEAGVRGRVDACKMAGTVLGVTTADAQLFDRSDQRVARDRMEHFLIQVYLQGKGTTRDGECIQAGDMVVIDLDQPFSMVTADYSNLTLVLPRDLNPRLSEHLAKLHSRRLPGNSPVIRLLAEHLRSLWNATDDLAVRDCGQVLKGTIGLMELWLAGDGVIDDVAAPEVSVAIARSIFRYIDHHIEAPLSPKTLTTVFNISQTQLYRIFSPYGGVARYIWDRRLRRSMRMLANPIFSQLNVSTIAFQCGFSSEPHFNRSFKARFGVSPSVFRRELRESEVGRMAEIAGENCNRHRLAAWIREI